ncbi:MAG: ammonia channel protein [Lysobacterales bacterium CG17_big_fil_post_rev_8_21_14_2_50_64_11]|nr:MAG: ammonia channel protein [Xanthomonadales bacterium CG17_big_fil_post_rev_8_21_14_2_50_64_11]PIX61706.1 MAG: ammonia channel protein [Xanthomonadales bacterium CG_4_10_14_3_um_filter_64_11]
MRCSPALRRFTLAAVSLLALVSPMAQAQAQQADSGDTAWLLVATALVLMMIIPGLALFYGGLVRSKNILSVLMQCFAITALISLLWVGYGYSLAFDTTGMVADEFGLATVIGGLAKLGLVGVSRDALTGTIPESLFIAFQLTFAAITPALIVGAFAERMRFGPLLAFVALWFTFAYLPVAHMTWAGPGGLFWDWGVLDFAGGTVVHINAGVAGLVACLVVGARRGWPQQPMPPHNLGYTVIGASLLWVGWFGFNAGSALAANASAAMALLVTQVATAAAALAWMTIEWRLHGKASVLGIATGAVAGLVAITPAAGSVGPLAAIAIGALSGVLCFLAAARLKRRLGYDDSLDVFGVHGVGGIVGALLTGVFADAALGGVGLAEGVSMGQQVLAQAAAISVTIVWSALVAWLSLRAIARFSPLRVDAESETEGLDLSLHDERGYNL